MVPREPLVSLDCRALELKQIFLFTEHALPSQLMAEIDALRSHLKIDLVNKKSDQEFSFEFVDDVLSLRDQSLGLLSIDFLQDQARYKRKGHRGKSESIAKALGAGKGLRRVLDATAGLAQDSFFLTQLGFEVTATERSAILYLLLKDGERRLGPEAKIHFIFSDAAKYICSKEFSAEAIYMDPMFPEKKKTALPRKEMQIFRKLVGDDQDATELLKTALASSAQRVVVKRPLKAPALQENPIHSFTGTTVRFDLYTAQGGK